MSLPYDKKFKLGRQSEQFLNEELHKLHEALKNINYKKSDNYGLEPESKVDGGLWFDGSKEELKYFDAQTLNWRTMFSKKFQITDQILNVIPPSSPIQGQLWINNGILMYFDGSNWQPIKAVTEDSSQWNNAAFEDYVLVSPLNSTNNVVVDVENFDDEYDKIIKNIRRKSEDTHKNTNFAIEDKKWSEDWDSPEIPEPSDFIVPDESLKSQFVIPNVDIDRIFVDNTLDFGYEKINQVSLQYPTKNIFDKTVSAIHLNPSKLTKIKKRLIKIDKLNPTINVSSYNTEFYGFKSGDFGGELLIKSYSQDYGDYVPAENSIILNYGAAQNYDYIMSITFDFAWIKSTGSMDSWDSIDSKKTFYLTNLQEPINVHADGLKLEETAYDIDYQHKTVTINDSNIKDVDVQMWSPYRKQFGYIREVNLEGEGIIRLHRKAALPLVFVGGTLIHPIYGKLKFEGNIIKVPNNSKYGSLKNMAWCVVDLYDKNTNYMYSEKGTTTKEEIWYENAEDYLDGEDYIIHGNLKSTVNEDGFRDYILNSGKLYGDNINVIHYDTKKINKEDGIILFVDGLLINPDDIERNDEQGILIVKPELNEGQEYVLLRDRDGRLYNSTTLSEAFGVGILSGSLVYLNGKLLGNENCVATTDIPAEVEADGAAHNEFKYFILDTDDDNNGIWKKFNAYEMKWELLSDEETSNVRFITSSYSEQLTSLKINIEYNKETDLLKVYTFKFANAVSGLLKFGECVLKKHDKTDGLPYYALGTDSYPYQKNVVNIFLNGVKLAINRDFKETEEHNYIKLLFKIEDTDRLTYLIEPIEYGQDRGYNLITLSKDDILQPNVYQIKDDKNSPELFPGRLELYLNGIRLPKEDWIILDNKKIMLKTSDYMALGDKSNFPVQEYIENGNSFEVTHALPDNLVIEIRYDYDRLEQTVEIKGEDVMELSVEELRINPQILDTQDEILFYLNGQYLNLSRRSTIDYKIDKYRKSIILYNSELIDALRKDPIKNLFDRNALIYNAWKQRTGKKEYVSEIKNKLTLVWK